PVRLPVGPGGDAPAASRLGAQGPEIRPRRAHRDFGDDVDFVSRFFAPALGVDEDPVTGSAHCVLMPFWRQRLGKTQLVAAQISPRGGVVRCREEGGRVELRGGAVTVARGKLLAH
ncbi:MAG: PhzF family phenazine biosynthesis protein, partial [Acidobacteriota bacterium]